jgi:hypothetical protein
MKRTQRGLLAGGVAMVLFLTLGAGACEHRGTVDAPIDQQRQDNQAPLIVNEPDQYMNFAIKCLGGDLLVAHTRNAAPVVTPNADACKPGQAEALGIPRVRNIQPGGGS